MISRALFVETLHTFLMLLLGGWAAAVTQRNMADAPLWLRVLVFGVSVLVILAIEVATGWVTPS